MPIRLRFSSSPDLIPTKDNEEINRFINELISRLQFIFIDDEIYTDNFQSKINKKKQHYQFSFDIVDKKNILKNNLEVINMHVISIIIDLELGFDHSDYCLQDDDGFILNGPEWILVI